MYKSQWLKKNGIEDGQLYVVYGGNTFDIKDELKEAGAHYIKDLGWYFGTATKDNYNLPEGFNLYQCSFDATLDYGYYGATLKPEKREEFKALHKPVKVVKELTEEEKNSQFVGKVGDRLRQVPAIFKGMRYVESQWGGSYIYTFVAEGNILIWFTQSETGMNIEPESEILLSGTVKDHKEYNGINQTYLSRCIIK